MVHVVEGLVRAGHRPDERVAASFTLPSSVAATLVYVTRWLTLEPGDVVLTGAPGTDLLGLRRVARVRPNSGTRTY
ncbi:fumarylacetoacetate hydrolase family protein [Cryobacterium sp. SO1]|uniref:fumarylacetoacetate hydrolase family protein n=1 Tax=Cryobacterium sp. SO1 TaxID=1897061 RepID=UPI001F0D2E0F|nr:fumarylacetoacetate hydrolase family protein [Cryobacterium sp. SO1]